MSVYREELRKGYRYRDRDRFELEDGDWEFESIEPMGDGMYRCTCRTKDEDGNVHITLEPEAHVAHLLNN